MKEQLYECNACDWRGPGSETVHPKHDDTCWVCPECYETITPAAPLASKEQLERWGITWVGAPSEPLHARMVDGYWTPWHLAQTEIERLRTALKKIIGL